MLTRLRMQHQMHHRIPDVMRTVQREAQSILDEYQPGHTEAFYEDQLGARLYNLWIPHLRQVHCFTTRGAHQSLVGVLDMEIAHNTILELKVGPKVYDKHLAQLRKYVQCKLEAGMQLENAAVVCFCDDGQVEIVNYKLQ